MIDLKTIDVKTIDLKIIDLTTIYLKTIVFFLKNDLKNNRCQNEAKKDSSRKTINLKNDRFLLL